MDDFFDPFLAAFPRDAESWRETDAEYLRDAVREAFEVTVPQMLETFWSVVGAGYFGRDRDLYFFGDGRTPMDRAPLVEWNRKDVWDDIYPKPKDGGPLFFAETCFGEQLVQPYGDPYRVR